MELNQAEFEQKLLDSLKSLQSLVEKCCVNVLSNNYTFILTEIDIRPRGNLRDQRLRQIELNNGKSQISFEEAFEHLFGIYSNLYDINITVYKALKNKTVIEVSYVLKTALEPSQQELINEAEPMYHARLTQPFYTEGNIEKFDVNWQHQEWKNWWKTLVWKWNKNRYKAVQNK